MGMRRVEKARSFIKGLVTGTLEFQLEMMPYKLENVRREKLLTLLRAELNCSLARPLAAWYPTQLHIEVSAACTLKCPLCPAGSGTLDSRRGLMSMDTYRALLDETGNHAVIAILWMWGEPFVNPRLTDMISYAHSKNVATVTSTNGQHLQTLEEAEKLVGSGLDTLIIALDGATQEVYSQYRKGGDIQKILRCMEMVHKAKLSLGSTKPRVLVRTVVNRHNELELPQIDQIARKYGANAVSRKTVFELDHDFGSDEKSFVPESAGYRNFKYAPLKFSPDADWKCRKPWYRMGIFADGTVVPCEFDYSASANLGKGPSFMKAWWSKEAAEFRERFLANKRAFPFCANCTCGWVRTGKETTVEVIRLSEPEMEKVGSR